MIYIKKQFDQDLFLVLSKQKICSRNLPYELVTKISENFIIRFGFTSTILDADIRSYNFTSVKIKLFNLMLKIWGGQLIEKSCCIRWVFKNLSDDEVVSIFGYLCTGFSKEGLSSSSFALILKAVKLNLVMLSVDKGPFTLYDKISIDMLRHGVNYDRAPVCRTVYCDMSGSISENIVDIESADFTFKKLGSALEVKLHNYDQSIVDAFYIEHMLERFGISQSYAEYILESYRAGSRFNIDDLGHSTRFILNHVHLVMKEFGLSNPLYVMKKVRTKIDYHWTYDCKRKIKSGQKPDQLLRQKECDYFSFEKSINKEKAHQDLIESENELSKIEMELSELELLPEKEVITYDTDVSQVMINDSLKSLIHLYKPFINIEGQRQFVIKKMKLDDYLTEAFKRGYSYTIKPESLEKIAENSVDSNCNKNSFTDLSDLKSKIMKRVRGIKKRKVLTLIKDTYKLVDLFKFSKMRFNRVNCFLIDHGFRRVVESEYKEIIARAKDSLKKDNTEGQWEGMENFYKFNWFCDNVLKIYSKKLKRKYRFRNKREYSRTSEVYREKIEKIEKRVWSLPNLSIRIKKPVIKDQAKYLEKNYFKKISQTGIMPGSEVIPNTMLFFNEMRDAGLEIDRPKYMSLSYPDQQIVFRYMCYLNRYVHEGVLQSDKAGFDEWLVTRKAFLKMVQ